MPCMPLTEIEQQIFGYPGRKLVTVASTVFRLRGAGTHNVMDMK